MNSDNSKKSSDSLADKIMNRIEKEHIAPEPRWHFSLKNVLFWTLWAFSVIAGSAAVSASLFAIMNSGWEYSNITHNNAFSFIIDSIPFLWMLTFSLMLLASYANFRLTKHGYRYPLLAIIGFGTLGSLLIGIILYELGIGDLLERRIGPHIPMHRPVMMMQKNVWLNPPSGLLAGEIESFSEDTSTFLLRAYDGKNWTIYSNLLTQPDLELLKEFKEIRIIGQIMPEQDSFRACKILPWKLKGQASFLPGTERPIPLHLRRIPQSTSSNAERELNVQRNTECEGVRPYKFLKQRFNSPPNP